MSWSPEQIAGWLKRAHPDTEAWRVSHETIYRSLYVQTRGVLKQQLMAHLRSQRIMRRSQHGPKKRELGQNHRRRRVNPQATHISGGSGPARPLARRPALRIGPELHRHAG